MGKVTSDYTKERLQGRYVDVEFETHSRGRYGRLLAYVIINGVRFNLELANQAKIPNRPLRTKCYAYFIGLKHNIK